MSKCIRVILMLSFVSTGQILSGGRHCSLSTPHSSVASLEAGYDPCNLYSLIVILTDGAYLGTLSYVSKW